MCIDNQAIHRIIVAGTVLIPLLAFSPRAPAQGCIPAHYMSLSLGARGIQYLNAGEFEGGLSYRYLESDQVYVGSSEQPQLYNVGGRNEINSFDLSAAYGISQRFALNLTMPFEHDNFSLIQGDGQRHSGSSGGLGDIRLVGTAWLFSPEDHPTGNINFGIGPKFPTGDYRATDYYHTANGEVIFRPVDVAAQLGDGGFGVVLQLQAFQRIVSDLYAYATGLYLINPRKTNGTERPAPNTGQVNSVPDQYFGRVGVAWIVWPAQSLSLTLGARIDGIPQGDLIGGIDDGFRRYGYSIYVDPGINWVTGKNTLSVNVPVTVARYIEPGGAVADFLVVASYSRRF